MSPKAILSLFYLLSQLPTPHVKTEGGEATEDTKVKAE